MNVLPPSVSVAIRDLCSVIEDNPTLKNGVYRAAAARLAQRLDRAAGDESITLTEDEIELAVNMGECVVQAIVSGKALVGSGVLMRVVERVVNPITDALGYPRNDRG